jgi:hypothetical protein
MNDLDRERALRQLDAFLGVCRPASFRPTLRKICCYAARSDFEDCGGRPMNKIPDEITLEALCLKAAQALARAGMQHRIDIYRDVEVDDPAVRMMLGRAHKVRVRVKITAASLLFESDEPGGDMAAVTNGHRAGTANGAAAVVEAGSLQGGAEPQTTRHAAHLDRQGA